MKIYILTLCFEILYLFLPFQKDLRKDKSPKLPRFNEYLGKYLKNAFGVENIRKEWSLSIYAAGGLMTECEDIVRFRKIIDNEVN